MSGERTIPTQQPKIPTSIEQTPLEQIPITGQRTQPINQLQRLLGNRRTQQLLHQSASPIKPARVQRAPGLPPLRGVLQRDDEAPAAEAPATPVRSSAASAFDHVAESDITLTDVQIRNAINFNTNRYQGRSIPALRRYMEQPAGTGFDAPMIRAIARYQLHFGLGTRPDGMIGHDTYDHIDLHQMLHQTVTDTPGTDADLIFSINPSIDAVHWDFVPTPGHTGFMNFRVIRRFSVEATMPQHAQPSQYRYRQMIRGNFLMTRPDGTVNDLNNMFSKIPGTTELPAAFREDGNTDWSATGVFYGRRTDAGQPNQTANAGENQYRDSQGRIDQRNGNTYRGTDGPGVRVQNVPVGTLIDLTMDFIGQIVRMADGHVMQQKQWEAYNFNMTVPDTETGSG